MSEPTCVVVNPASANGKTGRRWPELAAHLRRHVGGFDVKFTEQAGHGAELTATAIEQGATHIISVGGDGTHNEVINGFFVDGTPRNPEVMLSVVPTGTGGDLRRSLGLPVDALEAMAHVGQNATPVDVGHLSCVDARGEAVSSHFINITSIGIGGLVDKLVNESSKVFGGKASFLLGTLRAGLQYSNQRVRLTLDGGEPIERTVLNAVVANARYFGGGMKVAPNADLSDGLFDVVLIGDMGFFEQMRSMPKLYRGEHLDLTKIDSMQAAVVQVEAVDPDDVVLIDMDGEQPGQLPATLRVIPGAIRLCRATDG
jgi:YegS/Rv2252/BmrU family lipid kinase